MKRSLVFGAAALLLGAGALSVLCYNLWSYCCGHCTTSTFVTLGPWGLLLGGLSVFAGLVLAGLKVQRRLRLAARRCSCGALLGPQWAYCPDCGKAAAVS